MAPPAQSRLSAAFALVLGLLGASLAGCATGDTPPDGYVPPVQPVLQSVEVPGGRALVGSPLVLRGQSFPVEGMGVQITGQYQTQLGAPTVGVQWVGPALVESPEQAMVILDEAAMAQLTAGTFAPGGGFAGNVTIVGGMGEVVTTFNTFFNLDPRLDGLGANTVFLNDRLALRGDGFIGAGMEGRTVAVLTGTFTAKVEGATPRQLDGVQVDTVFVNRNQVDLVIASDLFGIQPGEFTGSIQLYNDNTRGDLRQAPPLDAQSLFLGRPLLTSIDPGQASLGQIITAKGAGFLAQDAARQESTIIRLDGVFQLDPVTGLNEVLDVSLTVVPEFVDAQTLRYVLDGAPGSDPRLVKGLGRVPGVFQGTVRPIISKGSPGGTIEVEGEPLRCGGSTDCVLVVRPPLQVVWIRFLANFVEGLRRFGLRNVEPQVRAQVLAQTAKFYADFNVEFREQQPEDFVLYSVIEVGGPDPNGAGLFGLDNTEGKDVGNERFNDYVGGSNAGSAQMGFYAFGGVFIESFLALSPTLPAAGGIPNPIASPRFDQIFGPFVPELGGTEAEAEELTSGPRAAQLQEAIRVLGNLIASTAAHEFGHSLGMSIEAGEFHNFGDEPGELMDNGGARPFEERAELDGRFETFSERHRAYLQQILPRSQL